MKKILLPTDFSATSLNAFEYALDIANHHQNAVIHILHVYDEPVISGRITPGMVTAVNDAYEIKEFENFKAHTSDFKKIAEEKQLQHIHLIFDLKSGLLDLIMEEVIENENIDFIVMGSNGEDSFGDKILGSNTYNTIINTKIPVLSVPIKAKFKDIKNILFTTNFENSSKLALEELLPTAVNYNAQINCLYVDNKNKDYKNDLEKWKEYFHEKPIIFTVLEEADSVKAVTNYIENNPIDLITTVKRNESFFEKLFSSSFTKQIANEGKIPLLAFH
jgi:nucleotide-binding universal stress UspA family protein